MASESKDSMLEIYVLAGFLGSGKTTLLRNILDQIDDLSDTAVIVNEFGQVGIDGRRLERQGLHMVELVNGCICCSLVCDLFSVLSEINSRKNIRRVFIEATGLAEPEYLISLLQKQDFASRFTFRGIISVLDARLWNLRKNMGPFFMNQLKYAAVVILNKIDLIEESVSHQIAGEITQELPNTRILATSYCDVELLDLTTSDTLASRDDHFPQRMVIHSPLASEYSHVLFTDLRPFDRRGFEALIRNLDPGIVRAKGRVRYSERTLLLNYSFGVISWEQMPGEEETCLEFIGKEIDKEKLLKNLHDCIRAE
jgi:G3E family GTPase